MATVYKPTVTKTDTATGDKRRIKVRCWYVRYKDADGQKHQVKGYTDRAATMALATDLERRAARRGAGIIDRHDEHHRRPLVEHLQEFQQSLEDKGNTRDHVALTAQRTRSVLEGIRAQRIPDIEASRVADYLARRRRDGLSIESSNHYHRAIRSFCRWLVKDRRTAENPIAHLSLLKPDKDRRHPRRTLTEAEFAALIGAAEGGQTRRGLGGQDRAMLYITAAYTGLRASELASLTPLSFDLDGDPPTVTLAADKSKHREEDIVPLRPDLVSRLRAWFADRPATGPLWPGNWARDKAAGKLLRADLEAAGILYKDASGRFADFHALRHTFVSNLARGGAHPKIAQTLARHKTLDLTLNVYTHTHTGDLVEALAALPPVPATAGDEEPQTLEATGTDDEKFAPQFAPDSVSRGHLVAPDGTTDRPGGAAPDDRKSLEMSRPGTDRHDMARTRVTGLEPATSGSTVRCSNQLSYTPGCSPPAPRGRPLGRVASTRRPPGRVVPACTIISQAQAVV